MQDNNCKNPCPAPKKREGDEKWFELIIAAVLGVVGTLLVFFGCIWCMMSDASLEHPATDADLDEAFQIGLGMAAVVWLFVLGGWAWRQLKFWWGDRRRHRSSH